jgi:NAD(P)H-hydrate epimerase
MGLPNPTGKPLSRQEIRALDTLAIQQLGVPGVVLMENAGRGAAEFIYGTLLNPAADRVLVLCGAGNNGGDGFVLARHLHNAGVAVDVALAFPPEKSTGDAGTNLEILRRMGLELMRAFEANELEAARRAADRAAVIVDALLGTGSTGTPRGVIATLIELANAAPRARRVAIDIPSGLDADGGVVHEPCFRADATVTMVAPKAGFQSPEGRQVVGRVIVVGIGVPPASRLVGKISGARLDG